MAKQTGNIVKKAIQIDASNSVRTVKSLKQEISDLRDELLNLDKGTKEYEDTQKQLQQDVEDLSEVMNAHKDKAKALEGSYNDLQSQLKELKTAWKETNDEAERDEIGTQIKSINDQLKEMDASIGDFHRNVGNYQSAWEGLNGVMDKSEKITDDLEKGIKAFGTAIGLSDKQVKSLSDGLKRMKNAFSIAKDIAKAKTETENLAAAETKAAAAGNTMAASETAAGTAAKTMAASEGVATTATKGLSIAMNGLKVALISTGIGGLIVLLGTLAGELDNIRGKIRGMDSDMNSSLTGAIEITEKMRDRAANVHSELTENLDYEIRELDAYGKTEIEQLEARKEGEKQIVEELNKELEKQAKLQESGEALQKSLEKKLETTKALLPVVGTVLQATSAGVAGELKEIQEAQKNTAEAIANTQKEIAEAEKAIEKTEKDIKIQKIKDQVKAEKEAAEAAAEAARQRAAAAKASANELKKWSDTIQDPKFQEAWKAIFNTPVDESQSPIDRLKEQYAAAIQLTNAWKTETTEVDAFFKQMISDYEGMFKSIQGMEDKMFQESLSPIGQLEWEKNEWIATYNKLGMDTYNLVKYYDAKIKAEEEKAAAETADNLLAKQKETQEKALAELNDFMSQVDGTLETQEKMNAIFNPLFMSDTVSGDIQQEMDNLQNLYNTQMEYLNSLLESAELTEEAYGAVEERILQLTVAFNSQMNVLKKEAAFQGKNYKILGKQGVATFNLLENAASSFSSMFQDLGKEDTVAFKAFATAQALISSYLAAARVLAEEPGPSWAKIAASVAIGLAGFAQVAAIWKVDPSGENAGSMNTQMATPVIGNSQPINYTRNITSAEEEDAMNAPVYVTVTDIEDGINGHKAQVTNSSF